MKTAALCVEGRIVVGSSHLDAYEKLTTSERDASDFVSGVFNSDTSEFEADCQSQHFYDKEILLIRHAAVLDPNNPDSPISEAGIKQARLLAYTINVDLNEFVGLTSPLLRCLQTSQIIQEVLDNKFQVEPQLAERPGFLEEGESFSVPSRQDKFPEFQWPTSDEFTFASESPHYFLDRTEQILHRLPRKSILVTHRGFICNLVRLALNNGQAQVIENKGVAPASTIYINRQKLQCFI